MPSRDLITRVVGQDAGFDRTMKSAAASASVFERELNKMEAQQRRVDNASRNLGRGMLVAGAAIGAGLALAARAAINWESAWAGVVKTVEGSPQQLAALEGELRGLAKTLPATHAEIAGVAEAAGQLGVKRQDIAEFTKTMIDLGISTNLSAEEAAVGIARLSNIMGTAAGDADKMGSSLVALGNDGASTEAEILEMATRIAAAGQVIGLTEGDVLGFANALSSVGIEAEAGGTAISKVFISIEQAARGGGEQLETFAKVAGLSATAYQKAYEEDAAGATIAFIEGLGRMQRSGGDVFAVLEQLGLSEIRVQRALLSAASAQDLFNDSVDLGNRAFEENTALIEEAERRYDTTASKIGVARNALVDFGIDIGNVVLPVVAELADAGATIGEILSALPSPVKTALVVLGGLATVVALTGGAMLVLAPQIRQARVEFDLLAASAPRVAAGLKLISGAAGIVGLLTAITTAIIALDQAAEEAGPSVGEITKELLALAGDKPSKITQQFEMMAQEGFVKTALAGKAFVKDLNGIDQALASLVSSGATRQASQTLGVVAAGLGLTVEQLVAKLPSYRDALAQVDVSQRIAADSAGVLQSDLETIGVRFGLTGDDMAAAATNMIEAWSDATADFVSVTGAYETALAAKEEKERETAQATADATSTSSDSWEDFLGDVKLTFDEYLAELEAQVVAQEQWATNMALLATRVPAAVLDELARLGPEAAPLVADMVNQTEGKLNEYVELFDRKTAAASQAAQQRLAQAQPELVAIAASMGQEVADKLAVEIARGAPDVRTAAVRLGVQIDQGVGVDRRRTVVVGTDLNERSVRYVRSVLDSLATPRWVTFNARTGSRVTTGGLLVGSGQTGGQIPGPPSQPFALVAHGTEWVIRPEAVAKYGSDMLQAINEMRWPTTGPATMAGPVAGAASAAPFDGRALAHAVAAAINGATLIIDDRGRGRLVSRDADLLARAG